MRKESQIYTIVEPGWEHEDNSTSSTLTVNPVSKKEQRNSMSVSFKLSQNVYHINESGLYREDIHELWIPQGDYDTFKMTAYKLARHVAKSEKKTMNPYSYKHVVEGAYKTSCKCEESVCREVDAMKRQQSSLQTACDQMAQLLTDNPDRLGLEKLAFRNLRSDKKIRRAELVDVVLEIQQRQKSKHEYSKNQVDDLIRVRCEGISLPSRRMAHFLAQALENSLFQQSP